MNKALLLLSVLIQLSSCSFHSFQFESIKKLVVKEDNSLKPQKNWIAYWYDQKIDLYAINIENQIIFADEDINIFYKDKQIYKITGLLPNNSVLEIDSKDSTLVYILNDRKIAVDLCETGQTVATGNLSEKYSRPCTDSKSENIYVNQVIINSEGLVISMQFKVHPDYPLLHLSMK